jgi:acyl-CoA synthetase (NDP forming)
MADVKLAQALFKPGAIALVGASANPAKTTSRPLRYLLKHGYRGEIYPINPNRHEIAGIKCHATMSAVQASIDHAFVMVGGEATFDAVRECVALGISCATILADGFAEAGDAGQRKQAELLEIARAGGVRILGPNSIGMINISDATTLSANAMLDLPQLQPGGLSIISQSGSMIGALLSHGIARDVGFSKLVSVGNEADLRVGEIGDMLVDDRDTDTILLFLETLRDSPAVAAMARRAFDAGKQILAYRLGRSDIGQELARSHTGAIAGSDRAFDAFLRHNAIARVLNFEALIEAPAIFKTRRPPQGSRVCVAATTGGGGAMVVDCLAELGVEISSPGQAVATRLAEAGVAYNGSKLVDLTIAGANANVVSGVISDLMANPDCDALVMVVGSSARFHPELAIQPLTKWVTAPKPLIVYLAPDAQQTQQYLARAGIAVFRTPEACADGVRAYLNWRKYANKAAPDPKPIAAAKSLINRASGPVIGEASSLAVFSSLSIAIPGLVIAHSEEEAVEAADQLSYPVALKIHSDDITHKTEVGGVRLNLANAAQLRQAYRDIVRDAAIQYPDAAVEGLIVQKMQHGVGEVLLGYKKDPLIGPIIMLGMGGVLAEIYRDSAIRLAPVTLKEAHTMIGEVKGLAPIRGFRNLPAGDVDALAGAIVNFSRLSQIASVEEAEINPLLIKSPADGVIALDGLIIRSNSKGI